MSLITKFDAYLKHDGPAALVLKEYLTSVEGPDGVIFPATFGLETDGGYNIDYYSEDKKKNICLIDSVGSQANRIEPIFAEPKYQHLIPQIVVVAGEHEINIVEAGHRAGDALVRCSSLQTQFEAAFKSVLKGDAKPLAEIAPTSLVFGVWDSRNTQAKLPRLVASTIRAHDIRMLRRSAVFNPATDYFGQDMLEQATTKKEKDDYSSRGFLHALNTGSHGGVVADGGVQRNATLGLAALRLLSVGNDAEKTLTLRRYILGLSLVSFTLNPSGYLRQGCLLVRDPSKPQEMNEVYPSGERKLLTLTHEQALEYATETAKSFGVGESKKVDFDKDLAKDDLKEKKDKTPDKPKGGKGGKGGKGKKGADEPKQTEATDVAEGE